MIDLNNLRWRCRRGTLELDVMLIRYLEIRYRDADSLEQQAFQSLLALEDSELIHYLMGGQMAASPELQGVVKAIRMLPAEACL